MNGERKASPAKKVSFKGKTEVHDPPTEALVKQAEAVQDPGEFKLKNSQFYGTIDKELAVLTKKQYDVLGDIDLRSADVSKMSRKIGKGFKYIQSLKDNMTSLSDSENEDPN